MGFYYQLLGALVIEENGRFATVMKSRKGSALLAYLLIMGGTQRREALADLLWESATTADSLRNLRKLLYHLRQLVPEVVITRQQVSYQPDPESVDLHILEAAFASDDIVQLDKALRLYRDELLAGFYLDDAPHFNEWLLLVREQLRQRVWDSFGRACAAYEAQQAWSSGVDIVRHWLTLDNLDEAIHRQLIQFLAANGQTEEAMAQYEQCRHILQEELGVEPEASTTAVATHIKQQTRPAINELAAPGLLPVGSIIPFQRNAAFIGRQALLLQLAQMLLPQSGAVDLPQTAVVTGMGGLGKSQLAVEFAYRYGRYFLGGVYWLSFADPKTVADAIAAIGSERGLRLYGQADELPLADQIGRVQRAWQEPIPRLLIFDNCESEELLAQWRPVTGGCRVLVTSRRGQWSPGLAATAIALTVLERDESVAMLRQLAPRLQPAESETIAAEIGDYPLALHLAGSFLQRYQQVAPSAYLTQLRNKGLLEHPSLQGHGLSYSPTGHELHVARTFAVNTEQLNAKHEVDQLALRLLAAVACFAPGEPLRQEILYGIFVEEDDFLTSLQMQDAIVRLASLGLLQVRRYETVVLHRLLVAYVKEVMLTSSWLDEVRTVVENRIIILLSDRSKLAWGLATLPLPSIHLSHLAKVARQRSDRQAAYLLTLWGCHQRDRGRLGEAEQQLKSALELHQALGTLHDKEGVEILRLLSNLYVRKGDYAQAQAHSEHYLAILENLEIVDKYQLALGIDQLGVIFMSQGRFEIAQEYLEKSSQLYQAFYEAHPVQGEYNLLNLGVLYIWKGEYDTALNLVERNLQAVKALTGSEHQETAVVLNYLGDIHFYLGNIEKAFALNEEALKIRQKTVGPRHLQTAFSLTSLGHMMLASGRIEEARSYLEKALAIRKRVQGKKHRLTAVCLCLLGKLHLQTGNLERAKDYLEQGLVIRKEVLGNHHSETAESLVLLGEWHLLAHKDREKARSLFEQAQATLAKHVAPTHVVLQQVQRHLVALEE